MRRHEQMGVFMHTGANPHRKAALDIVSFVRRSTCDGNRGSPPPTALPSARFNAIDEGLTTEPVIYRAVECP